MADRVFHVELAVRKWVEISVEDAESYQDDELSEEVETRALECFWRSDCTWGDEYEYETIKEVVSGEQAQ